MSNITIQIRVDSLLKEHAEAVFEAMGLKTSEAIRMFLQQTINDEALPFHPSIKKPNKATVKSFKEAGRKGNYKDSSLRDFKRDLKVD